MIAMDSWPVTMIISLVTIWALLGVRSSGSPHSIILQSESLFVRVFQDNIRVAAMPPSADAACEVIGGIIFFIFVLEFVLSCLFRSVYF
jgi:hypothetical protein